ncbi:uncharacterized protein LOC111137212 [Crassostrea virginica]
MFGQHSMSLHRLTKLLSFTGIFLLFVSDCEGSYRSYRTYGYYYYYYTSSGTSTVGSIIGGVISGIVFLGIAVTFCVFFCFCRKRRSNSFGQGVFFRNTPRSHQQAVITANTNPGVIVPQYPHNPPILAPGQTVSPPPGALPNNDAFNPPPPYTGAAPSYDSLYGQTNYATPPYPTTPR